MLEHLRPVAKLAALRFQRTPSWTKKRPPLRLDKRGRPFRLHHRIDPANGEADAMVKAEGAPRHPAQNQEKSHSAGILNPSLDTASLIDVKEPDREAVIIPHPLAQFRLPRHGCVNSRFLTDAAHFGNEVASVASPFSSPSGLLPVLCHSLQMFIGSDENTRRVGLASFDAQAKEHMSGQRQGGEKNDGFDRNMWAQTTILNKECLALSGVRKRVVGSP